MTFGIHLLSPVPKEVYTKTLGIEWHSVLDHFHLSVTNHTPHEAITKRFLTSDIATTYDVLGWFAPAIVKVKILLQKVWEAKVDWDDRVPHLSSMIGYCGKPRWALSPKFTSLVVIFRKIFKLFRSNSTDFLTRQNVLTLELPTYE